MAENTDRYGLLKKNPETDGNDTFNIKTMLNDNWDKLDQAAKKSELDAGIKEAKEYADEAVSEVPTSWDDIDGKPSEFPPESHTHSISDVKDLQGELDGKETPSRAQSKVDEHANKTDNPHEVTKSQVGLGNVDNVKQASKTEYDDLAGEFAEHQKDEIKHITSSERTNWNNKDIIEDETSEKKYRLVMDDGELFLEEV